MANAVFKLNQIEASYVVGIASVASDGSLTIHTDDDVITASRAASCLVPPGEGDEVAVVVIGDGRAFVTAILVAANDRPTEIAVDGDLHIAARGGTCRIDAGEGVELRTEGRMSLVSKVLNLRAAEGSAAFSKLTVLATSVVAHSDTVRFAAKALESFCDHVAQTAKSWQRTVEELDTLRAGSADYRTEKEMCIRAENYLVGARNLAKIDADQVHLG
ncbi:MAG TPA: DUF3540 domain-containing protein [Polyangiaceae bacterium]|jgi:hypothetical protein